MKSRIILLPIIFGMVFTVAMASQVQNRGAPDITLDGGTKGKVPFPHQKHQDTLGDCNICHDIFPQTPGVIKELKEQEELKKKQVMNHCRGCHRKMTKEGAKTGPTSCSKCHVK